MLKKLLLIMLITMTVFASSQNKLFMDINKTYSNYIYQDIQKENKFTTISAYEINSTQKQIKEDFEKILPEYLNAKDIFSKSNLKQLNTDNIKKYKWREFIYVSILYSRYLENKGKKEKAAKIMKTNFSNFHSLMINSENMIDYMIALILYKESYSNISNLSKEMKTILQKNPPPDKSIYFEKIEFEKFILFSIFDKSRDISPETCSSAKKHINIYFKKMAFAIKSESPSEINKFNEYIKKELEDLSSTITIIKLIYYSLKEKIVLFFGYKPNNHNMNSFLGKTIALLAIPKIDNFYNEHINMINRYNTLIENQKYD